MTEQDKRDELKEALRSRNPDDLAELCAELMLTYGVQAKSAGQGDALSIPREIREMGFVQLMQWMKQNLFLSELDQFRVRDAPLEVSIENDCKELQTNAPSAPVPTPEPQSPHNPPHPAPAAESPSTSEANPGTEDKGSSDGFSMLELD